MIELEPLAELLLGHHVGGQALEFSGVLGVNLERLMIKLEKKNLIVFIYCTFMDNKLK